MKHIKLFEGFLNENSEVPKITITPQYRDEKGNDKNTSIKYDVNYQIPSQEIEIDGVLKPYHTGRGEEYEFEPGQFMNGFEEDYYDEHSEEIEKQILDQLANGGLEEGREVMVADMDVEAAGLVDDIKNSLDFASAKLYDLKKMSDYIKGEYPELSKDIADVVEPMMTELENEYPKKLQELLKKFK
jgi:hypothetical protein